MISNKNIDQIFSLLKQQTKDFPLPSVTAIKHKANHFQILVITLLSARTTDKTIDKLSPNLLNKISSPQDFLKLTQKQIENLIYPVSFYKTKAKHLKQIAQELNYQPIPQTLSELLRLPGIGRKSANLILIEAFNKPGICVDTHVHRITNRWNYLNTKSPHETELELREILPKKHWKKINSLLVAHGQNICKPLKPNCFKCLLNKHCPTDNLK